MSILEFILSVGSGILTTVIVTAYINHHTNKKWRKAHRLMISKMSGNLASYHILTILDIDIMHPDEEDSPKEAEEVRLEIQEMEISWNQFSLLNREISVEIKKMDLYRVHAMALPTFTPADYHSIDDELVLLRSYTSAYYWRSMGDVEERDNGDFLKKKIIAIYR